MTCDRCGYADGTRWFGSPDDERALCQFCVDRTVQHIEEEAQRATFEQRWRTIQGADATSWAVHIFHAVPASWCTLCASRVSA